MTEPGETRRVRAIARGRVQGVGYRAHVAERARAAGLAGWVRNRPDGSVELMLEGSPGAIESVLEALRRGPRFGRVEGLEIRDEAPEGERDFQVRY